MFENPLNLAIGGPERHPGSIVVAQDTKDVIRAVESAVTTGAEIAVRAGGHSLARFGGTDGGILLDVRGLTGIEVNPGRRIARVGPG